jgi:hypothetical protein
MGQHTREIQFGEATLATLNLGEVNFPLARLMNLPAAEVAACVDPRALAEQVRLPVNTFHVRLPGAAVWESV